MGLPSTRTCFSEEMPAPRTDEKNRDLRIEPVGLPFWAVQLDRSADGVNEILLTFDDVWPRRREGVLEVRHEDVRAGVEGVDHHLPLNGPGDLHPALLEVRGSGGDLPVACTDAGRLGEEVRHLASVELELPGGATSQESFSRGIECAVQTGDEAQRVHP